MPIEPLSPSEQLWKLVRKIPRGKLASYGALGLALDHPISGYLVGRLMARAPSDLPWWRVVAKDGRLPVHKRDPQLWKLQVTHLRKEKIEVVDGVALGEFWDPE